MKIPESAAPSYYGDEPHWQGNGMMAESGGQYSGVSGAIPTPVYPPQIRGPMQPGYMGMAAGTYYPVYPGGATAPPSAGPLSPPTAVPPPHVQPHQHSIDFAEYMWMENEEEFDKQVMQQLEEEALMEQCIEAMLEDERERQNHTRHNGRQTNGTEGRGESSKSTLNPLAAEFVPGGGYAPSSAPASLPTTASAPTPATVPPTVTARSPSPPQVTPEITQTVPVVDLKEESPVEPPSTDESRESSADEKPSEPRPETPEEKVVSEPEPEPAKQEEIKVEEEIKVPAIAQPEEEKASPIPEVEAHPTSASRIQQAPAWKEAPQSKSRRKPTMAEMVGGKKGGEKVASATKPGREPKAAKSETRISSGASKGKEVRQVKSEPKLEQKSRESSQTHNSIPDKIAKEEPPKHPTQQSLESLSSVMNHVASVPKPINYAAAAKAKPVSYAAPSPQQAPQAKRPSK